MYDFTADETRIYAPAENVNIENEGFPQLTITDTGWTDEERNGVRAAYNYAEYLPERRRMMQEWADYLDELKNAA